MSFAAKGKKKKKKTDFHYRQTPHTALQKLSPKICPLPFYKGSKLRGGDTKKSTFLKNSHPGNGPMSFAAKKKKKKKRSFGPKKKKKK